MVKGEKASKGGPGLTYRSVRKEINAENPDMARYMDMNQDGLMKRAKRVDKVKDDKVLYEKNRNAFKKMVMLDYHLGWGKRTRQIRKAMA